jgi:tetratricopeptide (TPR) repeat protein
MSARALLASLVIGLSALSPPASAQEVAPPDPELAGIRVQFEYGKFAEALQRARARIDRGGLSDEDLAELHKYAGLAAFNLNNLEDAERHLLALLRLDPDYTLDPFVVPPPAIQYFEKLRGRNAGELDAIRQEKRAEAARRRRLEAERERARLQAEEQRRRLEELSRKITVREVERRSYLVNFVPFGAGQFQQGRSTLGILLATTQGALAAASIIGFLAHESLYTTRTITLYDRQSPTGEYAITVYGIPSEREGEARTWRLVKAISAGGFYVLYGYGVIDALINHQSEVVTTRVEDAPPPTSAPEASGPGLSRKLVPAASPGPEAYLFPLPGGIGAGLRLQF